MSMMECFTLDTHVYKYVSTCRGIVSSWSKHNYFIFLSVQDCCCLGINCCCCCCWFTRAGMMAWNGLSEVILNFHYNYSSLQPYDSLFLACTSQVPVLFCSLQCTAALWGLLALIVQRALGLSVQKQTQSAKLHCNKAEKVHPQIPLH